MGEPKALLDWFDEPLISAQIRSLLEGGADRVIVVTGAHHDAIADTIESNERVTLTHNPRWAKGKTMSIKAGLSALSPDCTTVVILAVDQPRPVSVVKRVLQSHRRVRRPVSSPRYDGHGGHPLIFDASLMPDLASISEENEGIREVMKRYEPSMNRVYFDGPIVRIDINDRASYESALERYPKLSERETARSA